MNRIAPLALLLALFLAGCVSISEKDRELALVHRNLAAQSLQAGDPRAALAEIEKSLERNPEDPEARNLYGLLLHLYFHRLDAAVAQYRQAIDLRPDYSEAKVNLGAAYTALGQCEKAIPLLEEARADLRYREPYLAENNLGWCKYELGDVEGAIVHLRAAIASNPGFCLGYRNLAQIAKDRGDLDEALRHLELYGSKCPNVADADYRRALVHLERGEEAAARDAFRACAEKAKGSELGDLCERQAKLIPEG